MNLLLLALGGGFGSVFRYLIGKWIMKILPYPPFPVAMVVVNVMGSLGLGVFLGSYMTTLHVIGDEDLVFLLFGVGFFGAFTTFSTFSVETQALIKKRLWLRASSYITLSIVGSILSFVLGFYFFSF